jgi:hypothetical protein
MNYTTDEIKMMDLKEENKRLKEENRRLLKKLDSVLEKLTIIRETAEDGLR